MSSEYIGEERAHGHHTDQGGKKVYRKKGTGSGSRESMEEYGRTGGKS